MSNLLDAPGVYDFCYGRGELFPRLTPEQEERLRERYLPEVEALEELLASIFRMEGTSRRPTTRRTADAEPVGGMSRTVPRRLPEIIGAGPGRTGTTWLHRVLEGHVDLPWGVKETQFFNTFYDKGIDWYAHHFRYATGQRKIVEICPSFFIRMRRTASRSTFQTAVSLRLCAIPSIIRFRPTSWSFISRGRGVRSTRS